MGLLASLDFNKKCESGEKAGDFAKIEYRLESWGEIFRPLLGNREHSIAARHILIDYPFKLFSISTPTAYLPQQLCLTFKAPSEVKRNTESMHYSGIFPDEIAKEFSAFLSLVTRRRIFAVGQMRCDEYPIEEFSDSYKKSQFQEKQRSKEISPDGIYRLLANLQAMPRSVAKGFVLAIRLYHSAVEMLYSEPEFSYLFLVMCMEAISSVVYKGYKPTKRELEDFLDIRYPERKNLSDYSSNKDKIDKVLLANEEFIFNKFLKFVSNNIPDKFWTEQEDDAKPDYLISLVSAGPDGLGKETITHSDIKINDWERIEKSNLKNVLKNIFNARSRLIHQGTRFPPSIIIGHFRASPPDAFNEILKPKLKGKSKGSITLKIPPLITFERLVSYSMVEFLGRQKIADSSFAERNKINCNKSEE